MVKIKKVLLLKSENGLLLNKSIDESDRCVRKVSEENCDKRFKLVHELENDSFGGCLFRAYIWLTRHPYLSILFLCLLAVLVIFCNNRFTHLFCENDNVRVCKFLNSDTVSWAVVPHIGVKECVDVQDNFKLECFSRLKRPILDEQTCLSTNCCWVTSKGKVPNCFYAPGHMSYTIINLTSSHTGLTAFAQKLPKFNSTYPEDVSDIKIDFNYRTINTLQVKIYDPNSLRYEPPYPRIKKQQSKAAEITNYKVVVPQNGKFGFKIVRSSNNKTIFDTLNTGGFIFSNYLLQISARLPTTTIYGLGQQRNNLTLDMQWNTITLFNHDDPPKNKANLYGSHPFYLAVEEDGLAYGVLLLNSNAMDIVLTPSPGITYRPIGGIFNFYFFMGPSPTDVVRQYTDLVGRPALPPYWSLGFHLCRFGYKTLNETINVWDRTRKAGIPFDTQWNDLDYMENGNDFTYNKERFDGLPQFVNQLHEAGMHYVVLIDPGISASELPGTYPPYDQGVAQQVFIGNSTGYGPFIGKVWNRKSTVWIDFLKPAAVKYWMDQLQSLHEKFPFDGAWIDMNDPSNFLNGTVSGCDQSNVDYPPYLPGVAGGLMSFKTLCMAAKHERGLEHYNVHNIYGLAEAVVTNFAMQQIRGKRAFVISRSSFPGIGHYAGVWTGDISSTWDDMAQSISDVLSFSLFGIPMSGADICGFSGNATPTLCLRWSQLGAFYPFARNHNSDQSTDQDPVALGDDVAAAARDSLLIRYSLLPYLYTLFARAHLYGDTVARPMFFEFPQDKNTHSIHSQFLWGPALLIAPVLESRSVSKDVYLAGGSWYDFYTHKLIEGKEGWKTLPAPLNTIPLLVRGGYIIPMKRPDTTTQIGLLPVYLKLLIALDNDGRAFGDIYWDDGDSLDFTDGRYDYVEFWVKDRFLQNYKQKWDYTIGDPLFLSEITVLGIKEPLAQVIVNLIDVPFSYNANKSELFVDNLNLNLKQEFVILWKINSSD